MYHAKLGRDMKAACQVVDLTMGLLELHPLSQRPQTSSGEPSQDHASAKIDISTTPTPNEWQDIALVAERAWTLLLPSPDAPKKAVHMLTGRLCQLIQCLVIGHLPNLDLHVQMLFHEGLQPILNTAVSEHREYTSLVVAMLSRLAIEHSLHVYGQQEAVEIFNIFSESQQAKP